MTKFTFSQRSQDKLTGVHPDLIRLAHHALSLSLIDFGITEGLRSPEKQQELIRTGKSQTFNSRHLTGHAIDIIAYPTPEGSWNFSDYELIAAAFKQASKETAIPVEWGGDWSTLRDGPHFQLPWNFYS